MSRLTSKFAKVDICLEINYVNFSMHSNARNSTNTTWNWTKLSPHGDHSLLDFAYTCVRDLFIGGLFTLQKKL